MRGTLQYNIKRTNTNFLRLSLVLLRFPVEQLPLSFLFPLVTRYALKSPKNVGGSASWRFQALFRGCESSCFSLADLPQRKKGMLDLNMNSGTFTTALKVVTSFCARHQKENGFWVVDNGDSCLTPLAAKNTLNAQPPWHPKRKRPVKARN